jgi:hypothetical protein
MTPKEKAEELVHQYRLILLQSDSDLSHEINLTIYAKKCALIAVDVILKDYSYMQVVRNANSNTIHSQRVFWQEVKQEIEKL